MAKIGRGAEEAAVSAAGDVDQDGEAVRDLTLALTYLTSWEEGPYGVRRCWKGYPFEALDELADQGLIRDSRRAKSAYLTEEGQRRARELLTRYGLEHAAGATTRPR